MQTTPTFILHIIRNPMGIYICLSQNSGFSGILILHELSQAFGVKEVFFNLTSTIFHVKVNINILRYIDMSIAMHM